MTEPTGSPPGGMWRLLWRLVPRRDRASLQHELGALHARRAARWGRRRADRWYRGEVLSLAVLTPFDALRRALRTRRRQVGGRDLIGSVIGDVRQTLRGYAAQPGFTAIAVATLALGIGASTAVFSLAYGVVLDPLPYPEANRLVWLGHVAPGVGIDDDLPMSRSFYPIYRERS